MSITERALRLISQSNLSELTRAGDTDYNRWVSIKRGRARVGADEVLPEIGQTSPDHDQANPAG